MNQILTAQKRARTKRRNEIEQEISRIEYLLANYKWDPDERKVVEINLHKLKQMRDELASDKEIQEANK